MSCPSVYELAGASDLSPELVAHLAGCPRCRALRAGWDGGAGAGDELVRMRDAVWPHPVAGDLDADPAPGGVHSIWGPEGGELLPVVVADVDEREAFVIPVSSDVHLAGEWDILLASGTLPYEAMAQAWNSLRVLREQVMERVALVPAALASMMAASVHAFLEGDQLPAGLRQGPALLTPEDPRRLFRAGEAVRAREFAEPWRMLYSATTFGGVVRARREVCALSLAGVSEEVDLDPGTLERLEGDEEDLAGFVAVSFVARLVRLLELPASTRLWELIGTAVFENVRGDLPELGPALARRRRGVASGTRRPPEDVRRELADRYVTRLRQRLEDPS